MPETGDENVLSRIMGEGAASRERGGPSGKSRRGETGTRFRTTSRSRASSTLGALRFLAGQAGRSFFDGVPRALRGLVSGSARWNGERESRSEEHTSELQSRSDI